MALGYFDQEVISFIDLRKAGERDLYDRHVTIEMAYDKFLRGNFGSPKLDTKDFLFRLLGERDDIVVRFEHLFKLENFGIEDFDTQARNAIEG